MADLKGVEIFSIGSWQDSSGTRVKYNVEDLDEIAKNFARFTDTLKPPLKFGHAEDQTLLGQEDGDPALGWVSSVRVEDGKLLADFTGLPDLVFRAIEKGLYSNVSVEIGFIPKAGFVLMGVALLGADLPAVDNLQDLQAFLSIDIKGMERRAMFTLQANKGRIEIEDHQMEDDKTKEKPGLDQFTDADRAELAKFRLDEGRREVKAELDAEKNRIRAFMTATVEALKPFEDGAKAGKILPAVVDKVKMHIEAQEANFKAGDELSIPLSVTAELAKTFSGMPGGETASDDGEGAQNGGMDADMELDAAALKMAAERNIPYLDAMLATMQANPDLAQRYKAQPYHIVQDWRS